MREKSIEMYSTLPVKCQAKFLARLAFEQTVWSRDAYKALTNNDGKSAELLAAHNELQHRICAHLMHLLEGNPKRYPDDVFINILFDMASSACCEGKLVVTFGSVLRKNSSRGG